MRASLIGLRVIIGHTQIDDRLFDKNNIVSVFNYKWLMKKRTNFVSLAD